MPHTNTTAETFLARQKALPDLGDFALQFKNLDKVPTEACGLVGQALGTGRDKVLEIEPRSESLFVCAGVGWSPEVVWRRPKKQSFRASLIRHFGCSLVQRLLSLPKTPRVVGPPDKLMLHKSDVLVVVVQVAARSFQCAPLRLMPAARAIWSSSVRLPALRRFITWAR